MGELEQLWPTKLELFFHPIDLLIFSLVRLTCLIGGRFGRPQAAQRDTGEP